MVYLIYIFYLIFFISSYTGQAIPRYTTVETDLYGYGFLREKIAFIMSSNFYKGV